MLSKEELAAFLALLTSFATKLALSEVMLARLIGVSHTTTVRWMKIARGELEGDIYRHVANPIIERLKRADEIDAERGLYEAIKDQRPGAKVDSIHLALRNRIW
jgi:transposase-like protein